jgi:hypothetical protein
MAAPTQVSTSRAAAQHRAQIRDLRRRIAINTPIIAACTTAAVCAFVFEWHILARVVLGIIAFMQLMHLPGLFTRLAEQKRKLAATEDAANPRS